MTRTPLPRPTLLPGLARLWRDRHTLQLGLDPDRAVLLEMADPAATRLLDLLDGTRSERSILDEAAKIKIGREDVRALIDTLHGAGLVVGAHTLLPSTLAEPVRRRLSAEATALALRGTDSPGTPAQILRRRAAAQVVVTGQGRLAAPVAVVLAQAGVGHVHPDLRGRVEPIDLVGGGLVATDVGAARTEAVATAIARVAPGTATRPVARGRPDLVIQVGMDRPAALIAAAYAQRRQAHLLLGLRDGTAVIGPLVPVRGSPCLNCLDLHRQDRDPAWPELAAQLAAAARHEPGSAPTLLAAVGYAAAEALTFLDGGVPETVGAVAEVTDPARIRRRIWPPHPACSCADRDKSAGRSGQDAGEGVQGAAQGADRRQSR
ncbi:MAG TPA: hypothetical protein VFX60_01395 [Micromonospora sp.]|nr:hypothetical protein [Micromonospora sp.]